MKEREKSIWPIAWVIIVVAVIITGAFGYIVYQNFQRQINDLKNRPAEVKTETIAKEVPQEIPKNSDTDYSVIVAEWQNRVAKVECNNDAGQTIQGSGVLVNITGIGTSIVTNKHVVTDENTGQLFRTCTIGVYGRGGRIVGINLGGTPGDPFILGGNEDWAYIKLDVGWDIFSGEYVPDKSTNTDTSRFDEIVKKPFSFCKGQVNKGDKIVVLGYPAIGTQGGITITQGIISGIEKDYYVTDAKIDHGNSGGAAILVKDSCYLGIPTWALNLGGFESLGRILKSSFFFNK